jgi:ankyrin repeat protein
MRDEREVFHTKLITTLEGGSQNRKEYREQILQAVAQDKRPLIQFFGLLNDIKPYDRHDSQPLPEVKLLALMDDDSSLGMQVFRFEAFPQDLLPPLHYLCALSASLTTIKACFKMCNMALYHDETSMGVPIHYACMFNAKLDLVQWLAKKDSASLELANKDAQMTPLHLACQYEADFDTVAHLTSRCPGAAKLVDKDGMTPLHWAASVEEPALNVVEDLTEVYADACLVRDKSGTTPLLCAIQVRADAPVIRDIIAAQPDCAALTDAQGHTPLYRAILMMAEIAGSSNNRRPSEKPCSSLDVIGVLKDLMLADKQCVKVVDERTGNLPVHTAVAAGITDMEVYKLLARKYSAGLEETNKDGLTPRALAQKVLGGPGQQNADVIEFLNPFES